MVLQAFLQRPKRRNSLDNTENVLFMECFVKRVNAGVYFGAYFIAEFDGYCAVAGREKFRSIHTNTS